MWCPPTTSRQVTLNIVIRWSVSGLQARAVCAISNACGVATPGQGHHSHRQQSKMHECMHLITYDLAGSSSNSKQVGASWGFKTFRKYWSDGQEKDFETATATGHKTRGSTFVSTFDGGQIPMFAGKSFIVVGQKSNACLWNNGLCC